MSIQVEQVSKTYGTERVVRHVSLEIETGELFVLLGASGSGKSTLLRLIAGLITPDTGRILLNERDVTRLPPQQRGTGFMFQNYSLFRHMTVAENIGFGLSIRRVGQRERRRRVEELLTLIDLAGYGDRFPAQLSGGQQQRVALARALAYQPNVLLLDEPFGALDVKIRAQLRQSLREIQQQLGVTAILVTHDQEEAFDIADRIGVIERGELLEVGTPSDLYQRPRTLFTATFLGTANVLAGQRNGASVRLGDVHLPAPPHPNHLSGQPVQLMCRPEELVLSASEESAVGDVIGGGLVDGIGFAGHLIRVTVRLHDGQRLQALLSPADARDLALHDGQPVWVSVRDYHLLPQQDAVAEGGIEALR
jgi:sulfate transport system ATP-binding protein